MLNIIRAESAEILKESGNILIKKLQKAKETGKRSLLLLSGGSAVGSYHFLARLLKELDFRTDNIAVGQVDERHQPVNPSDINSNKIDSSGLTEILRSLEIPFYKIPQTGTFREAAFNYDKLLSKLFRNYDYHIAVLGVGRDGHTAGLLRGYIEQWNKSILVIGYENRGEYKQRITITPKVFGMIDYGLVIASGIEKKEVIERIINKGSDDINNLPGILIHKIKVTDLVTDFIIKSD